MTDPGGWSYPTGITTAAGDRAHVIRDLSARAESVGLPLRLRVLRENRAKALYARLGFVRTGGTESPVLMETGPASKKEKSGE